MKKSPWKDRSDAAFDRHFFRLHTLRKTNGLISETSMKAFRLKRINQG